MAERAGKWLRVSSGGQDEANQEPSINKWIKDHAYEVPADGVYLLHGKSASKGKQDKMLDRVIADMKRGHITVLIVWQSSRIERRGVYSVFDLARRVREAGGRIEYTEDTHLNAVNEMSDVILAMNAHMDYQKSLTIGKQVRAAHDRSIVVTKLPWGYKTVGAKYEKRPVATPEGEKYVPEVYTRIADGQTLPDVCGWLTSVTTRRWYPQVLAHLIRNSAYRGQWQTERGLIACPRLVTDDLWNNANASLDGRPSSCRGRRNDLHDAALLSGVVTCGNPRCDATTVPSKPDAGSPMYKITTRNGLFYRCSGRGVGAKGKRRGCGSLVGMAEADALMDRVMSALRRQVMRPVFHPAEGYGPELADLDQQLRDLPAKRLPRADEDAERNRLRDEQDRYAGLPARAAWTEFVPVLNEAGEPLTYGAQWIASDQEARRSWMQNAEFSVTLTTPDRLPDSFDGDEGDGVLSTVDVYESDTAALIFRWAGDDDAGLGRALN
jgi:hypothetical protein